MHLHPFVLSEERKKDLYAGRTGTLSLECNIEFASSSSVTTILSINGGASITSGRKIILV